MKLRDGVENRIKEKLDKLKTRKGHRKLVSDILYPSRQREADKKIAEQFAKDLDSKINELKHLIRPLRSHMEFIGDPDKYVAAYLLIGKAYSSLKAISVLVRLGYSFQIVELVRSSMESLNLVSLFMEEGQEKQVNHWFKGKIIGNKTAREVLDKAINKMMTEANSETVPMKDALSDVYSIYSSYTHSGYVALFDFVDVFSEDFDFNQYSQFHYNKANLQLIDNLYVNILLGLKNFYVRKQDDTNLSNVEKLLRQEQGSFAKPEEIGKEMKRYKDNV